MTKIIILYKLKEGVTRQAFESWVRGVDYPTMRSLERVAGFETHRCEQLLIGEGDPRYDYVEIFEISDMAGFTGTDMPGETVQDIMGQFLGFAEAPQFIIAETVV